jgi:hypothetical protein
MPIFSFEAESYNTGAHFRIIAQTREEALVRLREFFSWALKGCKDLTVHNIGEENGEFGQHHQFDSSHFGEAVVQSSGWPPTMMTQAGMVYVPGVSYDSYGHGVVNAEAASSLLVPSVAPPIQTVTLVNAAGEPILVQAPLHNVSVSFTIIGTDGQPI